MLMTLLEARQFVSVVYKSKPSEYAKLKSFIGFLIGVLCFVAFYYVIVDTLTVSPSSKHIIAASAGCCFCISGALSIQARCIMLLTFPTFFGRIGRRILATIALSLVIQGPVTNMSRNIDELVHAFSCSADIAINVTFHRLEMLYNPMHDVMRALLVASHDLVGKARLFGNVLQPITTIVEDDSAISSTLQNLRSVPGLADVIDKYVALSLNQSNNARIRHTKKLLLYCLQIIAVPLKLCQTVDEKLRPHFERLHLDYTGSCPNDIKNVCDDVRNMSDEFDQIYGAVTNLVEDIDRAFDVDIVFAFETNLEVFNLESVDSTMEQIQDEMSYKRKLFHYSTYFLTRLLAFLFIIIFINAAKYQSDYMRKIEFDNIYVTWYFRHIDRRRKELGKFHLLPLDNISKQELTSATSCNVLPAERRKMQTTFLRIFPYIVVIVLLFLLDYFIAYALHLIAKHAVITFYSKGEHTIHVTIDGQSVMAKQLQRLVSNIHGRKHLHDVKISNQLCLPSPWIPDPWKMACVFALYAAILAIARIEAYGLRLRRIFCAFCHRKREKDRILWLYNKHLQMNRKSVQRRMQMIMVKRNALKVEGNLLLAARFRYPKHLDWLRCFAAATMTCLVCGRKENATFVCCGVNPLHSYCGSCWTLCQMQCIPCSQEMIGDN